ncbi:6821_t:CDS:2 [Paraglomus brasilianum]|uniref:6821_t:CDS:1 n=1 Tax=Paraglomus brasilianum TaxID=144538 RepID=A0A9N8ZP47_9GLOM|nr:6821_t:CDS:2 [Paraglomus brasilianum]
MGLQLYDLVVFFFSVVIDIFFREIRPRGSHKIPAEGPIIFVAAPHANQFVDPLILMRHSCRRVSFLIAAKSMKRKYIGTMARALQAIPVTRPQDLAKPGTGKIQLFDRKSDPTRIVGIGTRFTKELAARSQISLPKNRGISEVVTIISDTELIVKKEFKDLKALEMLTKPEGSEYYCIPHIDQSQVYNAVFETLNAGRCIGIFPEGGSHDRTEIMPLKAGVSIMALGAMAANPNLDVKIVPCGLNYFHAHHFRSRAVVEFGAPISVPRELVQKYNKGGTDKREACGKLLDTIYNGLVSVTVNTPDYETLMVIQAGRRLYKPAHRKLPISQVVELNRRFVEGYLHFKDDPRVQEIRNKVMQYNQLLKDYGLKDHQVNKTGLGGGRAAGLLLYRILILSVWTILGLPGFILNLPIVLISRWISSHKAKEAVAASSVKVAGRDVVATWKVLVALVVTPVLYGFYAFIVLFLSFKYDWPIKWKIYGPILSYFLMMTGSYATVRLLETGLDIYRSLRPLFLSLLPGNQPSIQNLRHEREKLSQDLTALINEYGPKIYDDFDAERIIQASKQGSKTPNRQSLFSSPVNWLDDKVFNWERAADSEYDDVFFFMDKQNGGITGRSRTSSWAASGASSASRSRTNSFGAETMRVESLTQLPRDKPFSEVNGRGLIPRVEVHHVDEDTGYQGDKEDGFTKKTQ